MGVILIHGVVSVDQRRPGCLCQIPGRGEGAEFTLGMNNVRGPLRQLVQRPVQGGAAQTGAGVNAPCIEGA